LVFTLSSGGGVPGGGSPAIAVPSSFLLVVSFSLSLLLLPTLDLSSDISGPGYWNGFGGNPQALTLAERSG
jgi:hypothetical protein